MAGNQFMDISSCILVRGIQPNNPNITATLRKFFENHEKSGGGYIIESGIHVTDTEREAVIMFANRKDAENVKNRKSYSLKSNSGQDFQIDVQPCPPEMHRRYFTERESSDDNQESFFVIEKSCGFGSNTTALNVTDDNLIPDKNSVMGTSMTPAVISSLNDHYHRQESSDYQQNDEDTTTVPATQNTTNEVPQVYQSMTVLQLQREQEELYKKKRECDEHGNQGDRTDKTTAQDVCDNRRSINAHSNSSSSLPTAAIEEERERSDLISTDSCSSSTKGSIPNATEKSQRSQWSSYSASSDSVTPKAIQESQRSNFSSYNNSGSADSFSPKPIQVEYLLVSNGDNSSIGSSRKSSIKEKAQYESTEKETFYSDYPLDPDNITGREDNSSAGHSVEGGEESSIGAADPIRVSVQSQISDGEQIHLIEPNQLPHLLQEHTPHLDEIDMQTSKHKYSTTQSPEYDKQPRKDLFQKSPLEKEDPDSDMEVTVVKETVQNIGSPLKNVNFENVGSHNKDENQDFDTLYALPKPTKTVKEDKELNIPQSSMMVDDGDKANDKNSRTVIVEGIRPGLGVEMLELYFESQKRAGGGPLETIDFAENSNTAKLVFEEKQVAERVLSRESHKIESLPVTVKAYKPAIEDNNIDDSNDSNNNSAQPIKIKVTGIQKGTSSEMLQLFFESKRRCGGGSIKTFEIGEDKQTAVIEYEDNDVAERVLAKGTLVFNKNQMTLTKLEEQTWNKRTVYVTGFDTMTEEVLELVYENKKKSGGGSVESVVMDEDRKGALVTFEKEKDAAQVLHQCIVKRQNGIVLKAVKPPQNRSQSTNENQSSKQEEEVMLSRSIMVLGLDENITEDVIEMLFESETRTGGGPIADISLDPEYGMAVVKFNEYQVAERVLSRESISFNDLNLLIQPHAEEDEPKSVTSEKEEAFGGATGSSNKKAIDLEDEKSTDSHNRGKFNCIEVSGIDEEVAEDFLTLFFENARSGGGEIQNLCYKPEQGIAIITFKEEATTKSVLQKHHDSPLKLGGKKIQIRPIDTSQFGGNVTISSCALEIKDLQVNTSEDTLVLYFENRRMCGGDILEEIVYNAHEGRAVITYQKPEVAQRVMEMHKSKPLHFESVLLDVKMMYSNSRPSQVVGPKEANTYFLQHLGEDTDADDICHYLERIPQCKVEECVFGIVAGTVLVKLSFGPGYEKFYELSCQKPLRGHMIDIESIPRSKSIEVYGAETFGQQKLRMYFEHSRSNGGDVDNIDILKEEKCAIITFVKFGVAEKVLSKSDHILERKPLVICLHHSCLGILPPDHDFTSPSGGIPTGTQIKEFDKEIFRFIVSTQTNRKHIEDGISYLFGEIEWPEEIDDSSTIVINCTLQRSQPNLQKIVKTWEKDVQGTFLGLTADYIKDQMSTLQECWDEFVKIISDLQPQNPEDVQVHIDQSNRAVKAIGKKNTVEQMMDNFRQVLTGIEEKLNRQNQIISEPVTNLKPYQIKFLLAHKFPQETKKVFQDMKVDADMKQCKVTFTGVPSDIITAKLQMYELVSQMHYNKLPMPKPVCKLVKQKKTRQYFVEEFQKRDIVIVFDVMNDSEVTVYAKTQEELTSGVAVLRSGIVERTINVKDESKTIIKSQKWTELFETLMKDHDGELKIQVADDQSTIHVVAISNIIDGMLEIIQNFLDENTIVKNFINMEKGTVVLLVREKKLELQKLEENFKGYSLTVEPNSSDEKPGINICGTKDGLIPAATRIHDLAREVVCHEHKINKPGMPKYFHDDRGKAVLSSLETRYQVVIVDGEQVSLQIQEDHYNPRSSDTTEPQVKCKVDFGDGRTLIIARGDLPTYRVDAIVNAANERMEHIGGLARAIVDKGGNSIQDECDEYVKRNGRLLPGHVYSSQSGNLPCRRIIHTVGPRWQGGYRNEENELYEAVYATLLEAGKLGLRSIAVPAISSGVFGFPRDKCCEVIMEAVKDYVEKVKSSLEAIHVVDNGDLVSTFSNAAKRLFGRDKVIDMEIERTRPQTSRSRGFNQNASGPSHQDTTTNTSSAGAYWKQAGSNTLLSPEGITVKLIKGSIIDQKVDVVINTTNAELNLGSGGVSALILQTAGPGIQLECKQNAPGGVAAGDFVQTSGGTTSWKKIFHGSCPHYNGPQCMQTLHQFINKCLTTAHTSGFTSIAIPAIGTGNLKYPRNEVAQAMYDEVKTFSQNNNGTSLTTVLFVVYDKDVPTVQAFEAEADVLKSAQGGGTRKKTTHRVLHKESSYARIPELQPDQERRNTRGASGGGEYRRAGNSMIPPGNIAQLHTENILIILVKGDLTQQDTDAIVNSSNDTLNFGSQVSKAILRAGGDSIAQECGQIGRTDKYHLAVTDAGNLQCKKIIHVAAPWDNFRYIPKWKERIGNILKRASDLHLTTISFPALGTGTMGSKPNDMAEAMFESFHKFGKKETSLQTIKVVVYEDHMIDTFKQELNHMGRKKKGIVEVLTDAVYDFFSGSGYYNPPSAGTNFPDFGDEDEDPWLSSGQRQHASFKQPVVIDQSIMSFYIYGFSQTTVVEVAEAIDKTCDSETLDKVLESTSDQEIIKNLTGEQIDVIKNLEKVHHVKITVEQGARINRLRIQGPHANVLPVMDAIHQIFRDVDTVARDKIEAEMISKQVQWQYSDGSNFETYPPEMNALIEKAYLTKETSVEFKEEDEGGHLTVVKIDINAMKEFKNGTRNGIPVRRYTPDSVNIPSTWSPMSPSQHFMVIDLTVGSQEYTDVEQQFATSYTQGGGSTYTAIVKIQRIQNASMFKKYEVHKKHMENSNPAGTINEKILWHGTTDDILTEIHTNGFNRSLCGRNGTAYGRGVYFATYTSLSHGYAKPNAQGQKHMYLCRVLTGEFTTGNGSLLVPPPKDPAKPNIKFDSVVDNVASPKMYVVFQDTQTYPEYLITYT